jgi:hypothetical protein
MNSMDIWDLNRYIARRNYAAPMPIVPAGP